MKNQLRGDLMGKYAAEKDQLIHAYEENISQLKVDIDVLNKEVIAVKECYIAVCREKDALEATLRKEFEQEQQKKKDQTKEQAIQEVEEEWQRRLDQAVEETTKAIVELKDCTSQTDPVSISDETSRQAMAKVAEEHKLQLQEVLKEKEKVARETLRELER
uniref:Uncharacterized protein n=1 Tax=Sphenodon punctatus TaxID=8508 RepID=A0A8D0H6C2_SPHPU